MTDAEFYLKMLGVVVAAGVVLFFMDKAQKKKERDAEAKFQMTMKAIELRNKKHGDNNES